MYLEEEKYQYNSYVCRHNISWSRKHKIKPINLNLVSLNDTETDYSHEFDAKFYSNNYSWNDEND